MDAFWSKFLQELALAAIPVFFVPLFGLLVTLIRNEWAKFKTLQPDIAKQLELAANVAVKAAEQAGGAGYIADKKAYALEVAQKWLEMKNVDIDISLIEAAIEAAVKDEFNKDRVYPNLKLGPAKAGK